MKDLVEAGHTARWEDGHYVVTGPNGIELGMVEPVGQAWAWAEFATEYDSEIESEPRAYRSADDAFHALLEHGGWLV